MSEPTPQVPILLPPDEQRIATRGDIDKAEKGLRREMRLLLIVGVATGNVLAAAVASYVTNPKAVDEAITYASRLVGL